MLAAVDRFPSIASELQTAAVTPQAVASIQQAASAVLPSAIAAIKLLETTVVVQATSANFEDRAPAARVTIIIAAVTTVTASTSASTSATASWDPPLAASSLATASCLVL